MSVKGPVRILVTLWVLVLVAAPLRAQDDGAAAPADAAPVETPPALLLRAAPPEAGEGADYGLLLREIGRQALLLAAREELGVATRDDALGEPVDDGPGAFDVSTFVDPKQLYRIKLSRPADAKPVWQKEVPVQQKAGRLAVDIDQLVEKFEALSRTEMPQALKTAGLPQVEKKKAADGGAENPEEAAAEAPPPPDWHEAEKFLDYMDVLAQFEAVRRTHARIRAEGESPEALGLLVRGYANLGQNLRFLWSPHHKAFEARSLLYAQRMVVKHGKEAGAAALYHRGYARAMVGLHASALKDLEAADALVEAKVKAAAAAGEAPPEKMTPTWAHLVRSACRYDVRKLTEAAVGGAEGAQLAMYLAFLTVETSGSQAAEVGTAEAALQHSPECLRLIDAMANRTGPGPLNQLTVRGPEKLAEMLVAWLPKMSMPKEVKEFVNQQIEAFNAQQENPRRAWARQNRAMKQGKGGNPARAMLIETLVEWGEVGYDDGEPSIAALGRIVQEITFAHTQRRADLITLKWGQDASGFVATALPMLAGHRYAPLIEAYGLYKRGGPQVWGKPLAKIKPKDPELSALPMFTLMRQAGKIPEGPGTPWTLCINSTDDVAWDVERVATVHSRTTNGKPSPDLPNYLKRLKEISPHSPVFASITIKTDWASAQKQIPQWEKQYGDHPALVDALAWKYLVMGKYDEAVKWGKRYAAAIPGAASHFFLAEAYRLGGDDDQYIATLEQYLAAAGPLEGLNRTRVQVSIAQHLLAKGKMEQALQYAEGAARSGAAWGMHCAMVANEKAGDWEAAEEWAKANAEQYDTPTRWYGWCLRTGKGDLAAARTAARLKAESTDLAKADREEVASVAGFYLYEKKPEKAGPVLKQLYQGTSGDPWAALHAAVLATDAGVRDEALKAAIEKGAGPQPPGMEARPHLVKFARWLKDNWARGGDKTLDLKPVDAIARACVDKAADASNIYYYAAKFMERHGRKDEALTFLKHSAAILVVDGHAGNQDLACMELRARGVDPMKLPMEPPPGHTQLSPQVARD